MAQIALLGLNTLGQSLGLALRKAEPSATLVGLDRDPATAIRAQQSGAVHRSERWADKACKEAALVILNEPMSRLRDLLEAIAGHLSPGCVVTSTAPVIVPAIKWADELLPQGVSFVAGHPILDPNKTTAQPSAELFQKAQFCVVPSAKAGPSAMDVVTGLAVAVGAQPFFMDAAEHDGLITAVEHLPVLLSFALMSAAAGASSWHDMRRVAGPAFAYGTSLAEADPAETAAALRSNRDNIARWLQLYAGALGDVRAALLAEEDEPLPRLLADAQEARLRWLADHHTGNWDSVIEPPKVTMGETLGQLIFPQRRQPDKSKR